MNLLSTHTITVAHSGLVALYHNPVAALEDIVNFDDLKNYYEIETVEGLKALYKKVSENMGRVHGSEKIIERLEKIARFEQVEL